MIVIAFTLFVGIALLCFLLRAILRMVEETTDERQDRVLSNNPRVKSTYYYLEEDEI